MTPKKRPCARLLGVVGGLGPLASADVLAKIIQCTPAGGDADHLDIVFEQHPYRGPGPVCVASTAFKIHVFDAIRAFEKRGIDTVVLPCFLSHTFIDELKASSPLQIVDLMEALRLHVRRAFAPVRRVGVLTSDYVRRNGLFERYFHDPAEGAPLEVLHPRSADGVTNAVYGADGLKSGTLLGRPVALLREACADLVEQGAQLILPGLAEIALVARELGVLSVPLVDANLVYAQYAVAGQHRSTAKRFKVGVVGGVGPAATVDFMAKIVRNTPAARDQDHIKLLVEQNPQIPDRTEHLIGNGADPTLSLYATCKKLEEGKADIIVIPCNTAHAFVERIQPYLNVPIVNMLTTTVDYLRRAFPALREVGLLATSGTLVSGVYRKALEAHGLRQIAPGPALQERVMNAIYGTRGVKAGFTAGECVDDIHAAVDDLVAQGIDVIVLGCTELPLLLPEATLKRPGGQVRLVDPTEVLARQCVARAMAEAMPEDRPLLRD